MKIVSSYLNFCSICQIQRALGCKNNPLAYDITAACSGFVLGLVSAACYIRGEHSFGGESMELKICQFCN